MHLYWFIFIFFRIIFEKSFSIRYGFIIFKNRIICIFDQLFIKNVVSFIIRYLFIFLRTRIYKSCSKTNRWSIALKTIIISGFENSLSLAYLWNVSYHLTYWSVKKILKQYSVLKINFFLFLNIYLNIVQ